MMRVLAAIVVCLSMSATAAVVDVPEIRRTQYTGVIGDLENRMPVNHIYRSNDTGNWAHETTHGLNSRIRNRYRGGTGSWNAVYLGGGKAHVLREPTSFTLWDVLQHHRDFPSLFSVAGGKTTLQWWMNEPLYILDEWSAYIASSRRGMEMGHRDRGSYRFLSGFLLYGNTLLNVAKQRGYSDMRGLIACVVDLTNVTLDIFKNVPIQHRSHALQNNVAAFMRLVE